MTSPTLSRILNTPVLTGALLLSLTYFPETARNALGLLASKLPDAVAGLVVPSPSVVESRALISALRALVAFGAVSQINRTLSTMAHNSWRFGQAKGWDSWSDEVAVVTGGSSGIGSAIVKGLVGMGVRVAVLDINRLPKDMQENTLIKYYFCDVTSPESVAKAAESVRRELGNPSILINNAGVANPKPILQTDAKFLQTIMGVNLMSMWFTTQQFLPSMVKSNKGHIVTVASIASFVALTTAADYSATKAGALAFHETLACELKHQYKALNVLTTVIHPNFVRTPLIDDISDGLERSGVRLLTADYVANAVVNQIKSKRSAQLVLPGYLTFVAGIRAWPSWLQEVVRDMVGKSTGKKKAN